MKLTSGKDNDEGNDETDGKIDISKESVSTSLIHTESEGQDIDSRIN